MTKLIKFLSFQVHSLFHKFIAVLIARFYLFIQDPIFNKRIGCNTNVNAEKNCITPNYICAPVDSLDKKCCCSPWYLWDRGNSEIGAQVWIELG